MWEQSYQMQPVLISSSGRAVYNMNQGWEFYRPTEPTEELPANATCWETVNLPHTVRLEPLNASGSRNYQGVCWYRKTMLAHLDWHEKTVLLHFDGAMQVAEISLNGKHITTHFGGYLPFVVDISGLLQSDKPNELLVKLDNSDNAEVPPGKPQQFLDFSYFGGLYRNVRLEVLDRLHISDEMQANQVAGGGIFVSYPQVSPEQAVVAVQTELVNAHTTNRSGQLTQELVDAEGIVIVTTTEDFALAAGDSLMLQQSLTVTKPALWHPYHPHLYTLRTLLLVAGKLVDARATRLGIRRVKLSNEGLFINGEKHFALGFNRHQDHPYVGYAMPDSQQYRDARKMREAGFSAFRSHYPQAPSFMDACDELGILCIISNPGWQFIGNDIFVERAYLNTREMVRRDRNHPSAVIWEPILNETEYPEAFCQTVHDIVHQEYPGDQCYTAGDGNIGNGRAILDVIYTDFCGNGDKVGDLIYQVDEDKPAFIREWGDSVTTWSDQQSRGRVARGWGEMPLLGQLITHIAKLNWDVFRADLGGGPAGNRLCGACLWAGIDHYRGYHHSPFYGGPLDLFRLPKFSYYFFQSQRPPEVCMPGIDSGPMVFIANYNTVSSPADVTVLSNCEEVRFYENGALIATQQPDTGYRLAYPPFTFKAQKADTEQSTYFMTNIGLMFYDPPEYRVEGLIAGKVVAKHVVKTPGVQRNISLQVDEAGRPLIADGADWVRIYARICDNNGTVQPFADDLITFTVAGEGAIIGDATIGANPIHAEAGIATILLQATNKPGKITLCATAFGLQGAEVVIESV